MKSKKRAIRHSVLGTLIIPIWVTQVTPAMRKGYAYSVYPIISYALFSFSNFFPFALGDLFIASSITRIIPYPVYARIRQKLSQEIILGRDTEYLARIYVWFYLAWGLNYSQGNLYEHTRMPYITYTPENFDHFVNQYIYLLNESYVPITRIDKETICKETVSQYSLISDNLGVHHPPRSMPQVKTMLFTPLISMVGVTGSMGPFFCEFTLNSNLLPPQYPAIYTHEPAYLLGITSEAEANLYTYQVYTRSINREIRFSGYFSILGHVLTNARRLMIKNEYRELSSRIRPETIELARKDQEYWMAKYSPLIGDIRDWIYDLYLKGNKIGSRQENYPGVIGLLISYNEQKKESNKE